MAGKKKPIEQYDHKGKKRVNNPPVGLVTPDTDKETCNGQARPNIPLLKFPMYPFMSMSALIPVRSLKRSVKEMAKSSTSFPCSPHPRKTRR